MNYTVIAVGRLKEKHYISACDEYARRLLLYCTLEIIELAEERPASESPAGIEAALRREAVSIRRRLPKGAMTVALCIEGGMMSSKGLAAALDNAKVSGVSHIAFIIGSSNGLDEEIKKQADMRMSMSQMTFPHHLARVMLLEQIYRAEQINSGGKYHK